ncbi:putative glycosyl transferase [Exophiala viscosa]|uniref:Glycosyl transferase n=1 Tax=Exophiala viscosa TaxID=2486360 RepID=A0AAN6DXQ6_9EURO|nr:putative glycosyl transferase [Exophiala viscosa]KAI1626291.1 putative glycosyl transferase [Exophiala viscosa]
MRVACLSLRQYQRRILVSLLISASLFWFLVPLRKHEPRPLSSIQIQQRYPLLSRHVHSFNGTGGAWYIPPHWLSHSDVHPENIVDAALLASQAANTKGRLMDHSNIPLIMHQTWKDRHVDTWTDLLRNSVEKWLTYVVADDMAYFFWEDEGILQFLEEFEPEFVQDFINLPANVERTDVFRILVVKWFGGIYADVDTQPLRQPATWISAADLAPWTDPITDTTFTSNSPVSLILGIEADTSPKSNDYWRMGYSSPIQLTQWALASSTGHPVLLRFMDILFRRLAHVANENGGTITSPSAIEQLRFLGPLTLTGPEAVTVATQDWLEEQAGLRWNALTGLHDGGRAKLVEDVLILPITAFSPGRGRYGNMGSKPVTHPAARVWHQAQGSWRSFNPKAEFGKFCRTFFGMCREWSKGQD